jgi:hypothetical protein
MIIFQRLAIIDQTLVVHQIFASTFPGGILWMHIPFRAWPLWLTEKYEAFLVTDRYSRCVLPSSKGILCKEINAHHHFSWCSSLSSAYG